MEQQKGGCQVCAAIAVVEYARQIAGGTLGLPPRRVDAVAFVSELRRILAETRPTRWSTADAQAVILERQLRRLAPDLEGFLTLRAAAKLVDLGARPVLSERAHDAVVQMEQRLHDASPVGAQYALLDKRVTGREPSRHDCIAIS